MLLIAPREGEVVGDSPDRRVEILSEVDPLHATWSRFGPGREGADLHVHRRHTDLFYVLEGELTVRLGVEDQPVGVSAGTLVRVPPMVVHGFRNASGGELRYLNLHAPGMGFADYLRGRLPSYDQEPPPAEGVRPASEATIGRGQEVDTGVTLLTDVEAIAIAEVEGPRESPPHVHRHHVESLYVLEGTLAFTVAGSELSAEPGSWVQIPPGAAHALAGATRFLEVHTPSYGLGALDQHPAG
jgi:quercetin dioxygenase-like cupin family protein